MGATTGEVTVLLHRLRQGEGKAADELAPLVYNELRRIAGAFMRDERPGHTLQPTALANEAWLRLADQNRADWQDRVHFFRVAARLMRRVLVDHARARLAGKRGGGEAPVNLDWLEIADRPEKLEQVLFVDRAIERLEGLDSQQARVVELHYFGGMSVQETAAALGVSARTVDRDWAMAKAWLRRELSQGANA
ncbi:MAG: sigma-70 family RNA polymerase sigma factor [bacterium]|nr:sigma-70 family RNA polymerase sigma factor [bacterium]